MTSCPLPVAGTYVAINLATDNRQLTTGNGANKKSPACARLYLLVV